MADRIARVIGSGFGSGHAPVAPGTAGSLVAVVLLYAAVWLAPAGTPLIVERIILAAGCVGGFFLGVWATGRMSTAANKDPGAAVWDEFVGMWLTCLLLPALSPIWLTLAFFIFRALDVGKPWPCRRLERAPAGWGIMLDDVGAGLWGTLILFLAGRLAVLLAPTLAG